MKRRWNGVLLAVGLLSMSCLGEGRPLDDYLKDLGSSLPDSGTPPDAGSELPAICSARNNTPARLHFVNGTSDQIVSTYWVDFDCREVFYRSLQPGQEADQGTFVGHVWRLRSAETQEILLQHVTTASETVVVRAP